MTTIKDVAELAGVSVSTVSRVMNNRGYQSEETREKVLAAMKELDYVPNELARSLQGKQTKFLGLIVPSVSNPFFGDLTRWIEYFAYERNYKLVLCNSLRNTKKELDYIDMLRSSHVAGIIMGSHAVKIAEYQEFSLPIVSFDRKLGNNIPYVASDNYEGGKIATEYLINSGAKKLIHVCGNLDISMFSNARTEAFKDVCEEAGVEYKIYQLSDESIVDFNEEELFEKIIEENPDVDAIFTTNDVSAIKLLQILQKRNVDIPADCKLISYDDSYLTKLAYPKLSSVSQPIKDIAYYLVDVLVKKIKKKTVPTETVLPVELNLRETT